MGQRMLFTAALSAAFALAGCGGRGAGPPEPRAPESATPDAEAPARTAIDWIHDDYRTALTRAKEENLPLVVDLWAPWCHTCLSMKSYVFEDPGLTSMAERFVWLAVDTDREANAQVLEKLPVEVWPTFYVVSPVDESVQARHLGAASVRQFREFLAQGEKGHLSARAEAGTLREGSYLWHLRAGDRAAAAGDSAEAAEAYLRAFESAPDDYVRRPDLMVSIASALYRESEAEACTDFAAEHGEEVARGGTAAAADFAYYVRECAEELGDAERKRTILEKMAGVLEGLLEASDSALSLDDRSNTLMVLRLHAESLGQEERARELARRQRDLLDRAVREAPTPYAAMTYAWPVAEVYVYLGAPEKAVPKIREMMEKLPNQYDPPHRLAWLYLKMGEHERALEMAQRALGLVYGPRKARIQRLVADIHEARGDRDAELAARRKLVTIYEELPEGQRQPRALERARSELAELEKR